MGVFPIKSVIEFAIVIIKTLLSFLGLSYSLIKSDLFCQV
ncbi:hypothetical protein NT03LS_0330 [Listeria seeligeri FSL N1-067]|uniref:Uncharacterized protein n=1 Tax=Listeria seeligeri FSL N1-067 TaxID=702453 RepID=E3ZLP5_LISSE|nr:hypothetical protein NT03LS_0330 [Listeria seeligeri FSL N1-067]